MAYVLDTIGVTATDSYKEWVLQEVFRYTGGASESATTMELTVRAHNGSAIKQTVRFRRGLGSVRIEGYDIAIPAGIRVVAFEFREVGETNLTATVTLTTEEQKYFEQPGILYIDEIRFGLNVSLG